MALWATLRTAESVAYFGLRQVLERTNAAVGTNLHRHDFRHAFAHGLLAAERG